VTGISLMTVLALMEALAVSVGLSQ